MIEEVSEGEVRGKKRRRRKMVEEVSEGED